MPISLSTSSGKARQHLGRAHAVQALGAGKIQERLVDRQRLDQRRQRLHGMAHLAADPDIFLHVGPDDDGVRAQRQRLEHRHRRAHAEGARDVAGGGDHAALAAADDDAACRRAQDRRASRPWRRTRRNRHGRASACRAARCRTRRGEPHSPHRRRRESRSPRQSRQKQVGPASAGAAAVTARRAPNANRSAPGARPQCWWDGAARRSRNAFTVASSRSTKSSTPARKCGSAAAVRRVSGPMPVRPGTGPAARGRRDEGKRLNCQRFQPLRGGCEQAFSTVLFAFP